MYVTSNLLQPSHHSIYCLRPVALRLYFSVDLPIFFLLKLTQWVKVVNGANLKYSYLNTNLPSINNQKMIIMTHKHIKRAATSILKL